MELGSVAQGLSENIIVGLIGGAIATLSLNAIKAYRRYRMKRRFPIAGKYLVFHEDLNDGSKLVVKSHAEIFQKGLRFSGENRMSDGRGWVLQGQVSREGYISGTYSASSPYDPGIGTFFLRIDGKDLDGLWSGYDSVNRSITGGRYWFHRKPDVRIVDLQEKHRTAALSIADATLGAGYLNDLSDGDGFHSLSTLVALDGSRVVGFATFSVEPAGFLASSPKYARVNFTTDIKAAERRGLLGHLRVVGVDPVYKGRGIGSALVEAVEQRLKELGAQSLLSFAWKSSSGTHIGGILEDRDFKCFAEVRNFWYEESERLDYCCAECGNPCHCTVRVYKKAISN